MANNSSTDYPIDKAVHSLACYTHIYQADSLVSIVEPNIFINGIHGH